eukprot:scaffold9085_cov215-Amphora_coffeaeformis.AAC.9
MTEFFEEVNYVNNVHMNEGRCVLTYMWGDLFRRSNAQGSILHHKLGIAPTPGSEMVLNRQTGQLERCTRELCPYAVYYDDIGFVNSAPYAANGGWGAAISANTSPQKQKALADFFLWASSREQSEKYVIPNSTLPWYEINGQDPWRKSHLDVDKWVAQGFDRELSKQYVESILTNLVSKNVVVEARFPQAGKIMSVLDKEVHDYLFRVYEGKIAEEDKPKERLRTAQRLRDSWNQIIKEYNSRGDALVSILEIYQRLRGVYVPNEQKNHLDKVRPVGLVLMAIIVLASMGSCTWMIMKRKRSVVTVSQPLFLGLICLGTLVMGLTIYVMGVDDSVASQKRCNRACMATPWLFAIGFSVCFSALFSKIWRIQILMKSAMRFRRVTVTVKDVILPFTILLTLNVAFLLMWTLVDPLVWVRIRKGRTETGERESYGHCQSSSTTARVMVGLVGGVNLVALGLANIQAYLTRNLSVAYDESKYIGLAMASILQAFLIGLPLLFLVDDNPIARYVVRSILVFVVCMSVLGFVFVPKMLASKEATDTRFSTHFNTSNANNRGSASFLQNHGNEGSLQVGSLKPVSELSEEMSTPKLAKGGDDTASLVRLGASSNVANLPEHPGEEMAVESPPNKKPTLVVCPLENPDTENPEQVVDLQSSDSPYCHEMELGHMGDQDHLDKLRDA